MTALADQILATLRRIAPDVDPATVDPTRPLAEQLDLDSMDYQNLLAALSSEHHVEIREADIPTLRSLDDLVAYITARAAPPTPSSAAPGRP
jgi:acyl carrier protein